MSKQKLEELTKTRKWAHKKLIDSNSKVYAAFCQMEQAAYSDGNLSKKVKELIAIGISVRIDCESCMQWHIEQAARAGASAEEVLEAVEVGIEMGVGAPQLSPQGSPFRSWMRCLGRPVDLLRIGPLDLTSGSAEANWRLWAGYLLRVRGQTTAPLCKTYNH